MKALLAGNYKDSYKSIYKIGYEMFSIFLFVIHLIFSLFSFGLIWFVQIVHYPMFHFLNNPSEQHPFSFHQKRAGFVVIPAMIIELTSSILLVFLPFPDLFVAAALLIFTLLTWVVTFMQAPIHSALNKTPNQKLIGRLIYTNWIKTSLWSLKAFYIFFLLWKLLSQTVIIMS